MPVSTGRRPLSKVVRDLCYKLDRAVITRGQFQVKLQGVISQYRHLGSVVYQDIGLALGHWIMLEHRDRAEEYWQLADQADIKIRKAFEHWRHSMSR